jgi:hypothetical protein
MATNPIPTTPTGRKVQAEKKNFADYMSADVLAAGGGFASDLAANAASRSTQSQIASGKIPNTTPKV